MVKDVTVKENDIVYCIEYLKQPKPGSWLTTKSFTSMEDMRKELALLEDFKQSGRDGGIVIRKYRVKKSFNTRQGIVGEQYETKGSFAGQQLEGGATQIEFGKYNPWARQKGYKGLIVPGARGNKDYVNIIVFDQVDLTNILKSITPVKLK